MGHPEAHRSVAVGVSASPVAGHGGEIADRCATGRCDRRARLDQNPTKEGHVDLTDLPMAVEQLLISVGIVAVAVLASGAARRFAARTLDDLEQRYNATRFTRIVITVIVVVSLVLVWEPLDGDLGPTLGIATAGLAFAMQEVVGAVAGWFNITFGEVFRVGDRIEMDGVHGDVIDISLLKTRLMETGSANATWVGGRQHTGRVVSISNKASFTAPVFNYSSYFDYIWEEFEVAIPHHENWAGAIEILEVHARRLSATEGARAAMEDVRRRFPVPATEVEPRVFTWADEGYMRLAARFVVPIRTARSVKDEFARTVHRELEQAGIEVIATSVVQTAAQEWRPVRPA
jgi:small-conductance mechanosensitive channel